MRALALLLALFCALPASAGVQKFAVIAGNNEGRVSDRALYFAEDDALKIEEVLSALGGYESANVQTLLGESRRDLIKALVDVRRGIARAAAAGDDAVFLFYYSGHADDNGLLLGSTWVTYEELEILVEKTEADVKLVLVDACNSGELTRAKGGVRAPSFVFDVSERLAAEGTVIITSSTSDELSQESDEIGGSYFTYFLVGGLYGSADQNGDRSVTLAEVYDYVYRETVLSTSNTRAGTQHPTFEWDLAGEGDVTLTELAGTSAALVFPPELTGTYAIFDVERRAFIGELETGGREHQMPLRPGRYLVQQRFPTYLQIAEIRLQDRTFLDVSTVPFEATAYQDDVAKGSIERKVAIANRPKTALRLVSGAAAPREGWIQASYFPLTPVAGAQVRIDLDRRWVSADLMGGSASGVIVPAEDVSVAGRFTLMSGGIEGGWATRPAPFRAGIGLRLGGLYMQRTFDEAQNVEPDSLSALTPGWATWVGWWPRHFQVDLELRGLLVPYSLDTVENFRMNEILLGVGYRF